MYRQATSPFGFPIDGFMAALASPCEVPEVSYTLRSSLYGFDEHGCPVFAKPDKRCHIEELAGMMVTVQKQRWPKSLFHTDHTLSLFRMAFDIMVRLMREPRAFVGLGDGGEKEINVRDAKRSERDKSSVWLGCRHRGKRVVIKTTSDPYMKLRYILDGAIHYFLGRRCRTYVPELHFVSLMDNGDVAICSEHLKSPSLYNWVNRYLVENRPSHFWNRGLWFMMHNICRALQRMQQSAQFTHRDCHANNVYYDMDNKHILFIDFDWSSIRVGDQVVSEPRFLYDTTRPDYGKNRSVDCCILFRSIHEALEHRNKRLNGAFDPFMRHVYYPLFKRYEKESKAFLMQRAGTEKAAIQLYKLSTLKNSLSGKFGHHYGVARTKKLFEYKMGYYEWACMTPGSILQFLNTKKHYIF